MVDEPDFRNELIGYLLGALEERDAREVEAALTGAACEISGIAAAAAPAATTPRKVRRLGWPLDCWHEW